MSPSGVRRSVIRCPQSCAVQHDRKGVLLCGKRLSSRIPVPSAINQSPNSNGRISDCHPARKPISPADLMPKRSPKRGPTRTDPPQKSSSVSVHGTGLSESAAVAKWCRPRKRRTECAPQRPIPHREGLAGRQQVSQSAGHHRCATVSVPSGTALRPNRTAIRTGVTAHRLTVRGYPPGP